MLQTLRKGTEKEHHCMMGKNIKCHKEVKPSEMNKSGLEPMESLLYEELKRKRLQNAHLLKNDGLKMTELVTSLVVQGLSLCTSSARGASSILCWGTKTPHAVQQGQDREKRHLSFSVIPGQVWVMSEKTELDK